MKESSLPLQTLPHCFWEYALKQCLKRENARNYLQTALSHALSARVLKSSDIQKFTQISEHRLMAAQELIIKQNSSYWEGQEHIIYKQEKISIG